MKREMAMQIAARTVAMLVVGGAMAAPAQAQGNGPGFHAAVVFGGGCNPAQSQTVSSPSAPATVGPETAPCVSGMAIAAGEAAATTLRASSRTEHVCCGTGSASNGRARIQIENVIITGPAAPSIPVSLNFRMRGALTSHPDFGQAGVLLFVRLSGFNTLMQSTSAIDMSSTAILNQSGVFAPLSLGFPAAAIDQAFVTPVANAAPNQPLRLDLELMAYSDMAGLGATESDFFTGQSGVALPFGVPVFNLPPGYTVSIPELNIFNNYAAVPGTFNGDIFIVGTNASEISLPGVTDVTGSVTIVSNTAATSIDLSQLDTVGGAVNVSANTSATGIVLPALTSAGDVDVSGNTSATGIELPALSSAGDVDVSGNTSATGIELPALTSAGDIDVSGNTSVTNIDLPGLTSVGDVTIGDNGSCTTVTLGSLATVVGDLTLESCGTGTFTPGPVAPGGNTTLTTTGYMTINGTTAAGTTTVSNATADALMRVRLAAGSFVTPVSFSIARLDPATLAPETGVAPGGGAATVDPIVAYQFTFGVPTLNHDATLTFDVYLAGLDVPTGNALLAALATDTATLATRGDAAGSQYQTFPLCSAAEMPIADGCVVVQLLDATGQPAIGTPAIVRFSNVVGHFSTWAVAIVAPQPQPANVFEGLLPPYPAPPQAATPTFKRGRVVPLKFSWVSATGTLVDSAAAAPTVTIFTASCASQAPGTEPITPEDAGDSGGLRYDAASATWILNWSTEPLAAGCYSVRVTTANTNYSTPAQLFPIALRDR